MPAYTKTITYQLAAAAATGLATSQSGTAGTGLNLNGSLVTGGVGTLDSGGAARRVIVTPAADESANFFTITGTDRYGRPQTEVLAGVANPAVAQTTRDFLTVTRIVPTSNTAGTVTAGTSSVGSSAPVILDWLTNGNIIGANLVVSGTVNATVQEAMNDLSPAWDVNANPPDWFNDPTIASIAANTAGKLNGPFTMARLTINSGTGTAKLELAAPAIFGAI